jgi:hypothetical protein
VTEVLVAIVTGLSGVLIALVGVIGKRLAQVNAQVSNSHGTNLRDDLDRVAKGVDQVIERQEEHSAELHGVRADLAAERRERAAVADRVTRIEDHLLA